MRVSSFIALCACSLAAGCIDRSEVSLSEQVRFTAEPTVVPADGVSTSLITLVDLSGASLLNGMTAVFASNVASTIVRPTKTDANNTFTAQISSVVPGTNVITVALIRDGRTLQVPVKTLVTFSNNAATGPGIPAAQFSSLRAVPTVVSDDGTTQAELTLTVLDSLGKVVPGVAVTFTASGSHNFFTADNGITDVYGVLTTGLASTAAEAKVVTAHLGSAAVSASVQFSAEAASIVTSSLVANPNALTADGVSSTSLLLSARDSSGIPLAGAQVQWRSSGSANAFSVLSATTDANGASSTTLTSTHAEPKSITATVNGTPVTTLVTFAPGLPTGGQSYSSPGAGNGNAVADGVQPIVVTTVAVDAQGNPVPGQTVVVTGPGGVQATGVTDANGVFTTTVTSNGSGNQTVTSTINGTVTTTTQVTFVPGPVSSANSTFTATPQTVVADGTAMTLLDVALYDAKGNPVPNVTVTLSSDGSANVFSDTSGTSDANGMFTATMRSTRAEVKNVLATVGGASYTAQVTFTAGAPSSVKSSITPPTGSVAADGTTTETLVVTVADAYGNPVSGQTVGLSSTGTNVNLTPLSAVTAADGTVTATIASSTLQTVTVTATVGVFTETATVTFSAGAPSGATTVFSASPSSVVADGTSTATLTVTVHDSTNNPVVGQAVTLSSTGGANTLSPTSGVTDASGVFVATLKSTLAEPKTITAFVGSFNKTQTIAFVAGAPSSSKSTFAASPAAVTADNTSHTTLTFVVADAQGNPVTGQAVTFASSGSNNTLSASTGTTNASGTFTATLASSMAETKTITATSAAVTLTQVVSFFAGSPNSATSSVVASPSTVTADGATATTVTVTVRDAQNNVVSGQSVTLALSGTNNTLSSSTGSTNSSGIFTATLASTKAQTETVTATFGSASATSSVTFVAGAASSASTTLIASPTSVIANGSASTALTVTVKDAQGNPVASQTVMLSSTGSNNVFNPVSGSTNSGGVFTSTLASTTAEVKTITASVGSVNKAASVTFTAGAPDATNSTFVASPTALTADGSSISTLTLTVKDAQGNLVAGQSVSLSSSGTANTFSASTGSTNASGVFAATLASIKAESKTVTATAGSISKTATVLFQAGAVASSTTTLSANPTSVTADGASSTTVTLTALDAQGNPVAGQTVTLSSTGTANAFSASSGTTNASGVFTATLTSTHAEAKTITATIGSVTKTAPVTFTVGAPSNSTSTVSASPTSITADGATPTTITVTIKDAQGNAVPSQTVTLSSSGTGNTFGQTSGSTNSSGVFATTMVSTHAETKTITATAGAAVATANVQFNAGTPASATSTLTAAPASVAADGTSISSVTTTVLDAQGNPVAGQTVTITSVSGSNNTLTPSSGTTNSAGAFVATLASTTVETKVVTVNVASLFTKTTNVTFTTPLVSSSNSSVVPSPASLVADGTTTTTLTITVKDGTGTVVPNQTVTLTSSGTSNTFTPSSGTTNSSGVLTVTMASTHAESKTITATVDGTALTTTVTFTAGAATSSTSTFSASPNALAADGASTSTLTLVVRDVNNNPVPGKSVTFSSNGSANTFSITTGTTDATGTVTATLASTVAQSKTVTAALSAFSKTATVTFSAGAPSSTNTTLVAAPISVVADGSTASTLTVTVKDAQGNVVASQAVSLTSTGTNNVFSPASGTTNVSGVFTATLASTKAETKTVTATLGPVTKTAAITFTAGAPANSTSTLVASPTSLTADGSATTTLTLTVHDAQGNPIGSQAISLASSGSGNTFGNASGSTNASGVFTTTLKSTVAEAKTLTATIGSITETATVSFTAGAASNANTNLVASPSTLVADGSTTTTLTLTVRDAQGNLVANQAVSIASSGTANTLTPSSGTTNASGIFTATLASTKAEVKTVTATIGSFTKTSSVTFNAGAPSAANTTFVANPNILTADGSTTSTLRVIVQDAQGNLVSGQSVSLSSTGSGNAFSPSAGSTVSGVFNATMTSTVAQTKTITATVGSVTKTATLTFQAGAASSTTSTLTASPSIQTADGNSVTTVTVTVLDAKGNAISGQSVSLAVSGSGNTLGSTSGTSNTSGVWTTTIKSTKAESKTLTATIAGFNITTTASFVAGSASSSTTTLAASPTSLVDDGVTTTTLTVTVMDANGNLVNGQAVTFSAGGTGNTFGATTGSTNSSGIFTTTLKSTVAQTETITVSLAGFTKTAAVTFTVGAPNSAKSSLIASPTSLTANGTTTTTLTVTVKDSTGNLISGQSVSLASTGSNNTFSTASGNTVSGVFTATLKSTTAQSKTVTATIGSINETTTVTFLAGPPSPSRSSIVVNPNSGVAADSNRVADVTVTLKDAYGNPVTNQPLTLSATNTSSPPLAVSEITNINGVFTFALKSQFAGPKVITALASGIHLSAGATFSQPAAYCSNASFYGGAPPQVSFAGTGYTNVRQIVTGLVNNDSYIDLVMPDAGDNVVGVALGLGNGRFGQVHTYATGSTPSWAALCQLAGNGNNDVVVVNQAAGTLSVLHGSSSGALSTASTVTVTGVNMGTASVECLDVTGDGLPDAVVSSAASSSIVVLPGNGTGSFGTAVTTSLLVAPYTLDVKDVSGDGNQDVVYAANNGNVYVLIGKGGARFNAPVPYAVGAGDLQVAIGDINNDSKLDLVTADYRGNSASVLLNKGGGTFGPAATVATGQNPNSVTLGDVNGDGKLDIIQSSVVTNEIYIAVGNGDGSFRPSTTYQGPLSPSFVVCADANNDSKLDILTSIGGNNYFNGASILLGNGDGNFRTFTTYPSDPSPAGLVAGDVNGDGYADLVVTSTDVQVFINDGTGLFAPGVSYAVALDSPVAVALSDINHDGALDIITTMTNSSGGMALLLNEGNGTFNGISYDSFGNGSSWGVAVSDYNSDGYVDVATGNRDSNSITAVHGVGNANFSLGQLVAAGPAGSNPAGLIAGDLNGDGNSDLVAAFFGSDAVGVLLGNGSGAFGVTTSYTSIGGGSGLGGVAIADLNLDGYPDVCTSELRGPRTASEARGVDSSFLGSSTGALTAKYSSPFVGTPYDIAVADMNGDGIPDMISPAHAENGIVILLGIGDGTFAAPSTYTSGKAPYTTVVADFNRDGRMDFAQVNQSANTLSIHLWTGCP